LDTEAPRVVTGTDLMESGQVVRLVNRPAAAVIIYQRENP
jgi:hypothetical protein